MTKEDISDIIVMHSNSYNCLSMLMNICCQERRIEKVEDFAELLGENYSTVITCIMIGGLFGSHSRTLLYAKRS